MGKGLTRHHILAKARGGNNHPKNILMLTWEHHRLWHKLFGNLTLSEIIAVLQRIERMQGNKRRKPRKLEDQLGMLIGVDSPF